MTPTSLVRMTDVVLGAFLGHAVLVVVAGHVLGASGHATHLGFAVATIVLAVVRTVVARSRRRGTLAATTSTVLLAGYLAVETIARHGDPAHALLDPWLWLAPVAVGLGRAVTLAMAFGLGRLLPAGGPVQFSRLTVGRFFAVRRPERPALIHLGSAGPRAPPLRLA